MRGAILNGWSFIRWARLTLVIVVIVHGSQSNEWSLVALGVLFSVMQFLNISCCGTAGCNIPPSKTRKKFEDTPYEDV